MTDADILERAADLLYVKGRTHSTALEPDGRMCALGAVACASGISMQPWHDNDTYEALRDNPAVNALATWIAGPPLSWFTAQRTVFVWNDDEDDDEVIIDGLRRCAKDLRAVEA